MGNKIDRSSLKQRATQGDAEACYELAMSYVGNNKTKVKEWLFEGAKLGNTACISYLAEFYNRHRAEARVISNEDAQTINEWAILLFDTEKTSKNSKAVHTLFRVASQVNLEAKKNLAYCKFEGIGVAKNFKAGFELLYDMKINGPFSVLTRIADGVGVKC